MEGFNQNTSLKQFELNENSVFSPSSGTPGENELDILSLFGKEKLKTSSKVSQKRPDWLLLPWITEGNRSRKAPVFLNFARWQEMTAN